MLYLPQSHYVLLKAFFEEPPYLSIKSKHDVINGQANLLLTAPYMPTNKL